MADIASEQKTVPVASASVEDGGTSGLPVNRGGGLRIGGFRLPAYRSPLFQGLFQYNS